MKLSASSRLLVWLATPALTALAACGGGSPSPHTSLVQAATVARVDVPGADLFSPFAVSVRRGAEVVFHNSDSDTHSAVTVPGDPSGFDMKLTSGTEQTVTLDADGVYRYYCSIHARYDPITGQVQALPNTDHIGQPMEGVIVVTG